MSTATETFARVPTSLLSQDSSIAVTYAALDHFARQGEDSPTLHALCRVLNLASASTIVRRLDLMERAGLIRREPWPDRKRTRYVLLAS